MKQGSLIRSILALVPLALLAACDVSNPSRPTMSFASPSTQSPANGIIYNFNQQPITVAISNSLRTGTSAVTYSLEVSKTSAFTSTVFTRDGIAENAGGVTSVQLSTLEGNTTYYWRWRAVVDGIAGEPSAAQSFFVRPNVTVAAPALAEPVSGDSIFSARPTFKVTNAVVTGPAGTIFYEFQVSTSAAFGSLLASATIQQQTTQTQWTPNNDLPEGQIFWRVRASDPASGITSSFSGTGQFERRFGIDLATIGYVAGHPNISTWKETAKITSASHSNGVLCIEHTGNFPATGFIFDPSVAVEGNQWMFVNINGKWWGGAGHWYRPGQACKGEVDERFFVDAFRANPPFDDVVLHDGDVFGVAVSTPARAWPAGKTTDERSNVVLIVW